MTTSQAVRAIDVGFGNTKFVLNPAASGIQCSLFPSLAPLATNDDLTGGVLQKRNTVVVEVNG